MNIILIAPPAAGKGTQSELICNQYNLSYVSTGNLLRETIAKGDQFGLKQKIKTGSLISDDIIMSLIRDKVVESNDLIFDGFPRNIEQAKSLDILLKENHKKIDYVIYLSIDKFLAQQRIVGRRSCPTCRRIYNTYIESLRPKYENICDDCKTSLMIRDDDNEETFENRYRVYKEQTEPILEYYKAQGILYEIDANRDKFEIFKEIEILLGEA